MTECDIKGMNEYQMKKIMLTQVNKINFMNYV